MIYARLEVFENRYGDVPEKQRWRWRLVQRNGRIVASSGEGYARPGAAEAAALKVIDGTYDVDGRVVRVHDEA